MKPCCSANKYIYSLDADVITGGCDTCGHGTTVELTLNRYCAECRKQLGYSEWEHDYAAPEFTTIEDLWKYGVKHE